MQFGILGPLNVTTGDALVRVDAPKQRALLAVLILHANQVVSSDRLLELLWGDSAAEGGIGKLRFQVSKLRDVLDPARDGDGSSVIVTRSPGYVLETEPETVDAVLFDRLVGVARSVLSSDPGEALGLVDEALALWRGPVLGEFEYEEWAQSEIRRLTELHLEATEDRFDALVALGRGQEAVGDLEALVVEYPRRERLRGTLMLALYQSGRQADALATYQDLRRELGEGLGIDPSVELQNLEERILLQDRSLSTDIGFSGDRLRGYVLSGQIGEGAHGVVYRAAQSGVGREVAIKTIRAEFANDARFVRRFEAEAQVVASLEHPHIVSLFDFWRDPDGAYLVMPYLQGGNLAGMLDEGPLEPRVVMDMADQLGSALAYAHRRGVVHRDVTPENVLLDEDGNPYLADFGVASLLGAADAAVSLSPGYLPPEVHAGGEVSPASDVFSLGVLCHAALTGVSPTVGQPLPSVSSLRPGLPVGIDGVVARATATDVADRYTEIDVFVDELSTVLGGVGSVVVDDEAEVRNPFKGLRAFKETDAADFFGRAALASELVGRLERKRLVGVVGPSGCGKSSLVRAGLIPLVRAGELRDSDRWLVTDMYPGSRPFSELEAALLRIAVAHPGGLAEALTGGGDGWRGAADVMLPEGAEVLLIVDQFEELFTLTVDEEVRRRFLDTLSHLATDPLNRVRIVLTMRADFYDRPLEHAVFGDLLRSGLVSVTTPDQDSMIEAIVGPATGAGLAIEPGLAETIATDVANQPGGLPLMEYALTELFARRSGNVLTGEAYRRSGGVLGALGWRAEDLYATSDEAGKAAIRQVFLRLVMVEQDAVDTRRRIPASEVAAIGIEAETLERVLHDYGSHRLLTFDRDPNTRAPTIEVAHEALLARWDRLRIWIEERRDDLVLHRHLATAVAEWDDNDRDDAYLLAAGRLDHYEMFVAETDLALTDDEQSFLEQSRTHTDSQRATRRRRRQGILAGFAAIAVVALIFAVAALYQSSLRASEAAVNHAGELANGALANLDTDPELSVLLALEAVSATPEPQRDAVEVLHEAVLTLRTEFLLTSPDDLPLGDGAAVTTTPDGIVASTGAGEWITLHDGATGSYVGVLEPDVPPSADGVAPGPPGIDANPTTGDIAAVYEDGSLRVWDTESERVLWSGDAIPGAPVYSPDGRWLAVVTDADSAMLSVWDATVGEQLWVQELTGIHGPVVSFSPLEAELAIAWWSSFESGTGQIAVLDRATGAEKRRVDPGVAIGSIAWSRDGTQIFHGSEAGALMVWTSDLSELVTVRTEHSGSLEDIEFSADGSLLATRSVGGTIKVWTTDPLDPTVTFATSSSGWAIAFSPDGGRLFAAYDDGTVRAWTTRSEGLGEGMAAAPTGSIFGLDVGESGEYLLAHSIGGRFNPGGATLWRADTGELQYEIDGLTDFSFGGAACLTAGDHFAVQAASVVAVADSDETGVSYGPIQIREGIDGTVLFDLEGSEGFDRQQLSASSDGRYLASGGTEDQGDGSSASVYDTGSGRLLHRLQHPDAIVTGTAFSPDGTVLATGSCGGTPGALRIWDWEREVLLREVVYSGCITRAAFSPTEPLVAVVGYGPALVWDVDAGHEAYTLAGDAGDAFSVTFSPDGRSIVTAGMDGMLRIWDAADGSESLAISLSSTSLGDAAFFPDGGRIVVSSVDGNLWVVALDTDDLAVIAQDRLTRTLTEDECVRYHVDPCPAG